MFKLHVLNVDSWEVPVTAGPTSQVAEDKPRVRLLGSKITGNETKCWAVVAVADASKRESNVLRVLCAKLDFEMTR